jgi:hypothetical protein
MGRRAPKLMQSTYWRRLDDGSYEFGWLDRTGNQIPVGYGNAAQAFAFVWQLD